MATVRYFWHGFMHRGTTFMYLQYGRPPIYHLLPNVWKVSYTISTPIFVDVPYLPPYSTDSDVPDPSQPSLWRGDRNRMYSYRVSTADVPESPIASDARGLVRRLSWTASLPPRNALTHRASVRYGKAASPHVSRSPWKHSCVLRPRATSILVQERCSSSVNMVLELSHYPYESQRSTHCSKLTEYCHRWLH